MRLLELHIYGFGKLENVHFTLDEQMQVFYGENEAGKSTIMAFISAVLFGFPTKQQAEQRYEPKLHVKYGGMLRVHHPELGIASIERVKGKAAGDVTVILESGKSGGEELLKQLLSNMDKGIFQAIFSFNLHGLQNIHQMKKEEIGNFLFSAGMMGTDQLAKTEASLKKELELRFKPTGRNPQLNSKVQALQELKIELKKAASKNSQYEGLIVKHENANKKIAELHEEIMGIREERNRLMEWKKIQPLVIESMRIEKELGEIGQITFPQNGLAQMDKQSQLIKPYEARIISTNERIDALAHELELLLPDERMLADEVKIVTTIEKLPLFEQLKFEKQQWEMKLGELRESLSGTREKLHLDIADEELLSINTNFYMKERAEAAHKKQQQLDDAKAELDIRFNEEKDSLEKIENDWNNAKAQLLSENERLALENGLSTVVDKKSIEIEHQSIREQIDFLKNAEKRKQKKRLRQRRNLFFFLVFFLTALLLYSFLTHQLFLGTFGFAASVLLGVFIMKGTGGEAEADFVHQQNSLQERKNALAKKMLFAESPEQASLRHKLEQDVQQRERCRILQLKWEQQNEQYEKVINKFEKWEDEAIAHAENVQALAKELRIPYTLAQKHLLVSFQLIEQFKTEFREKQRTIEKMKKTEEEMSAISAAIVDLSRQYLEDAGHGDLQKAALFLREKLTGEREKRVANIEKGLKLNDLRSDLQQLETERAHLQAEVDNLLRKANAADAEQFYEIGKKTEKYAVLAQKLHDVKTQLDFSYLKKDEIGVYKQIQDSDQRISELENKEKELRDQLSDCQNHVASLNYEIQMLEEGGVYSSLLHRYSQRRNEFEEDAKEWAVYALAHDLLVRTVEKYKNVHMPRLLSKAEEFLFHLTDGNYVKLYLKTSGTGFLIEGKDRLTFEANELSQATTEQVYVALRLALAVTLYEKFRFPILIDDSFVNFDRNRTAKVMELLFSLKDNQLFFFTCHQHLLVHFQKEKILYLTKEAVNAHF